MIIEQIKRVDNITPKEFKEEFLKNHRPLVFKSFAAKWKATSNWNFDFFREHAGDLIVPVAGDWTKNDSTQINRSAICHIPFNDFLREIEKGPSEYRLFAFNLFKSHPEFKNDFNYPNFANRWLKMPFLFFGGEGSSVRLHYDFDNSDVFLTQFSGKKKVTLFHPGNSKLLYKQPFTTHSHLNMANPSFEDTPTYPFLEAMETTIECGDTLYIPARYWHFIEYETSGFSLAIRSLNASNWELVKGAFLVIVTTPFDTMMSKLFPDKWPKFKLKKAKKIAEKSLAKIKAQNLN